MYIIEPLTYPRAAKSLVVSSCDAPLAPALVVSSQVRLWTPAPVLPWVLAKALLYLADMIRKLAMRFVVSSSVAL